MTAFRPFPPPRGNDKSQHVRTRWIRLLASRLPGQIAPLQCRACCRAQTALASSDRAGHQPGFYVPSLQSTPTCRPLAGGPKQPACVKAIRALQEGTGTVILAAAIPSCGPNLYCLDWLLHPCVIVMPDGRPFDHIAALLFSVWNNKVLRNSSSERQNKLIASKCGASFASMCAQQRSRQSNAGERTMSSTMPCVPEICNMHHTSDLKPLYCAVHAALCTFCGAHL